MTLASMPQNTVQDHQSRTAEIGPFPDDLSQVMSVAMADAAREEIQSWPSYKASPLRDLAPLAQALNLGAIFYKDESERLGLGSFKALGGSYAVLTVAADFLEKKTGTRPALSDIRTGKFADTLSQLTVTTATDGNHGRSVAWGAQMAGCPCTIFIHAEVSEGRKTAMEAFGATVTRVDGDYDFSLTECANAAEKGGWTIVSDTSYEGYMEIPRQVMAGYSVMATEAAAQVSQPPTHVFTQAGVGGLAAAVCARFWQIWGEDRPQFVIVEPERAACVLESARQDKPMLVTIEEETIMAGLSCGEISLLAWDVLSRGASHFISLDEAGVKPAMRALAAGDWSSDAITAGESAVPGLVGAIACARDPGLREKIGLGPESRVLVFGCEGATDPAIYNAIIAGDD